jgi:hypothetical protein
MAAALLLTKGELRNSMAQGRENSGFFSTVKNKNIYAFT